MKNILLLFSIIFFTVILKSDAYSTTSKTCYVSASGTLAECFFDNEVLNLSLLFSSGSSANYTLLKSAENPAEYSNSEIIFRDEGSEVFVKYSDRSEEKFLLAEKYSGTLPDNEGKMVSGSYFFSDAVNVLYVYRGDNGIRHGHWYLLKGEPLPGMDSTHNTTQYELLESDKKTNFRCFLREGNKLILLPHDCSLKSVSEYYIEKQD